MWSFGSDHLLSPCSVRADDAHDVYTRKEQDTGLTYTFTDSTIRNPGGYREKNNIFGSRWLILTYSLWFIIVMLIHIHLILTI